MTDEKILIAVELYWARFKSAGVKREWPDNEQYMKSPELALAHCYWMLDDIIQFVHAGQSDKA